MPSLEVPKTRLPSIRHLAAPCSGWHPVHVRGLGAGELYALNPSHSMTLSMKVTSLVLQAVEMFRQQTQGPFFLAPFLQVKPLCAIRVQEKAALVLFHLLPPGSLTGYSNDKTLHFQTTQAPVATFQKERRNTLVEAVFYKAKHLHVNAT